MFNGKAGIYYVNIYTYMYVCMHIMYCMSRVYNIYTYMYVCMHIIYESCI